MTLNSLAKIGKAGRTGLLWFWAATFSLGLTLALTSLVTSVAAEDGDEATSDQTSAADRHGLVFTVDGPIGPATLDYLKRGLDRAADENAGLIIIRMDTPGGLLRSTRSIIQDILSSRVPVATYVSPSGARAASAGTYIMLASHIAAMAPATHMGSATPVQMGGLPGQPSDQEESPSKQQSEETSEEDSSSESSSESSEQQDESPAENGDDSDQQSKQQSKQQQAPDSAMSRKMIEDAVAYIRELAERHGRNADWAERAVREAVNVGADRAVEINVADVVATDINELLEKIDGRTVNMASGELTLNTEGMSLTRVEPDWRTELLSIITDPNVAYFLMLIGFYGIIFELSNPGSLYPGVIGAICLLLALFAFQVLSVNYAGLALILLGLAFIVGEAFMPSFGILGIGGVVSFVVGSIILMDGTNQDVSLPLIGGVALLASGFMLWAVTRFLTLRKSHVVSGREQMLHEEAVAVEDFTSKDGAHEGKVWLSGERWNAVSEEPVSKNQRLQVTDIKGLTAYVKPK